MGDLLNLGNGVIVEWENQNLMILEIWKFGSGAKINPVFVWLVVKEYFKIKFRPQ